MRKSGRIPTMHVILKADTSYVAARVRIAEAIYKRTNQNLITGLLAELTVVRNGRA